MSKKVKKAESVLPPEFEAAMRKIAKAPKEDVERAIAQGLDRQRDCGTSEESKEPTHRDN